MSHVINNVECVDMANEMMKFTTNSIWIQPA